MQNYVGIKKNSGYILYVGLTSQADTKLLQVNPTIAAGDFKVSIDGGAFANLGTLPTVTPAGGRSVKITLSAGEMNGDNLMVMCVDAAGAEWCDLPINIQTTPVDASLVQVDGTANASATLNLTKLNIVNSGGSAIVATSSGSNGHGIFATGNGSGVGVQATGGATGDGINAQSTAGNGIAAQGGTNKPGLYLLGNGTGSGLFAAGGLTGNGFDCLGGATSGDGVHFSALGSGHGIDAAGASGGAGIIGSGNGSGAGIQGLAGATGVGIKGTGGSTSGEGIKAIAIGGGAGINAVGVGNVSLLATQGVSGPLDTATYNAIADALLIRDWTLVAAASNFSVLNAMRFLRNKWSISGATLTVTKENEADTAWTATLTTDATALPVISFTGS